MTFSFSKHFLLSAVILASIPGPAWAKNPVAQTTQGEVVGKMKNGVAVYRGIPYAQAPTGNLRWHAPLPRAAWTKPLNAFQDGSICLQPKGKGVTGSEDCLSLNIWAASEKKQLQPVMVFIHGGFYVEGSSDTKEDGLVRIQDGQNLAELGQMVVVSLNYRLGVLGFFANPALNDGSIESQSGNFGLMDQLAALKWVQENISAFGGDPARVTVFGQSAGASSVLGLLASPLADGLFSQAIVESGYLKAIPKTEAYAMSDKLVTKSDCEKATPADTAACLRELSGETVVTTVPISAMEGSDGLFVPNQDGWIIPEPLDQAYQQGHVKKIPIILGTNTNESESLASSLYGPPIKSDDQLAQTMIQSYGDEFWEKAKPVYENASFDGAQNELVQLSTDAIFTCPISTLARELAPTTKVWRYVFNHHIHFPFLSKLGAFHGVELIYVFGSEPRLFELSPDERHLAKTMRTYWANFARNGDPNSVDETAWPGFQASDQSSLEITESGSGSEVVKNFRSDRCEALKL